MKLSLSQRIIRYLSATERIRTNMELAKVLKAPPSQVSSVTCRLAKMKVINRTDSVPYLYYKNTRKEWG